MTDTVIPKNVERLADALTPPKDAIIEEMNDRAIEESFPTVGTPVGGWLELLTSVSGAERIFEFGSGFGYSAYWFARGLDSNGEVILTDLDETNLDAAREYFRRGGMIDRARFEHGDAIKVVEEIQGPFDIVLIDNEKPRYVEALEAVREKLQPGSLVIADNAVTAGTVVNRDEVVSLVCDGSATDPTEGSEGIAAYLDLVRNDPALDTVLLPLGEGLAVSLVQ